MKIYAVCLVKNEDDVIGQTLTYATRYCDRIFVIDNGSTDGTWKIVKDLAVREPKIVPFLQTLEPFEDGLRWLAYEAHHQELSDSDWWLFLDADEFLAEDPKPVIQQAMREGADIIKAWQIQFYYTAEDHDAWMAGRDSREVPILERRRYYRIDWQEPRLFRNQVSATWETAPLSRMLGMPPRFRTEASRRGWKTWVPASTAKMARRRILNRHYQYRDPPQIEKRLEARYGRPAFAAQVDSLDWRKKMRRSEGLNYYTEGQPYRFSVGGLAYYYWGWVRYIFLSRSHRIGRRLAAMIRPRNA